MSGDLGSLVISLTAETAQFKDALTKSAYQMDQSMGQMVGSIGGLQKSLGQIDSQLGAFGINLRNVLGMAAGGAFAGLIASSIESAAHVQHLSEQTGIAADQLAAMKGAAVAGGITLDEVAKASTKFSKAIETQNEDSGVAAKALTAMGLSMEEVKAKSPAEQLHIVAERLNTFADGSGKAAAAQVLFGKAGVEILPFLKQYGEQVNLTKEGYADYAKQAQEFEISLSKLKGASNSIVTHYAMELLPTLKAVVDGFTAMNSANDQSVGFMSIVGEAVRVLSLGIVVLWTFVKNLASDLMGGAKAAWLSFRGDLVGAYEALEEARKKTAANTDAMLAFSDKALAGSKVFGDTAASVKGIGDAGENVKQGLNLAATALADTQKEAEALQKILDKLNGTDTAYEATLGALAKAANTGALSMQQYNIYAKLAYDQSKAGTAAHAETAKALQAEQAAMDKLVTAEQTFHDTLQKQIDLIGATKEEMLKYDAAEKGLGDSQDELIHQNVTLLQQEADKQSAFRLAGERAADYAEYLNAVSSRNQDIINGWQAGNQKLTDQINQLGLTKSAVERLQAAEQYQADQKVIFAQADTQARADQLKALQDEYNKRLALIDSAEMKQAYLDNADAQTKAAQDAAAASQKAFEDSSKSINKSLVDALFNGFQHGKSLAEDFKNALINMFKNLVLRPLLQPVSDAMAGAYQQGSSYLSGIFGAGGAVGAGMSGGADLSGTIGGGATSNWGSAAGGAAMGGWGGILAGAAIGGAISSQYGSKSPVYGTIAGAGAMIGMAGATGVVATAAAAAATAAGASTAAAASVAAAVPVIGWIVAAIAIIASFAVKPGGGPKVGSFQSADYVDGLNTGRSGYQSSGGGDTAGMNKVIDQFNASYIGYIKALGGKAISAYSVHSLYETDPQGTASSYGMFIVAKPGQGVPGNGPGQANVATMASYYNSGKFDPTAENFQLYASRALLASIQQSELPQDVANLLTSLVPDALNSSQISNVLAYAEAFHSLPDKIKAALAGITGLDINPETSINLAKFGAAYNAVMAIVNADPGKDVQGVLDQANMTAIEKFRAQGVALSEMAAKFDGSADAALNLAQATATYYQNQIQLLAALEQSTAAFHKSIGDLQRSIKLDTMDNSQKVWFYVQEIAQMQDRLAAAVRDPANADPASIAAAAEQAKADYQAWWATLDETQKAQQGATFLANLDALDAQLAAANKAIGDAVKAQNDPANPNSPVGQVKGAFDKFMLDMNQWLIDNRATATDTTTAANTMSIAANTMAAAADAQLAAANTPTHVDLTINGTEVTAGSG